MASSRSRNGNPAPPEAAAPAASPDMRRSEPAPARGTVERRLVHDREGLLAVTDEVMGEDIRARIEQAEPRNADVQTADEYNLLVDGRMDGVWSFERKGRRLVVEIEPFVMVAAPARRASADEAERLAAFLGGALELSWAG